MSDLPPLTTDLAPRPGWRRGASRRSRGDAGWGGVAALATLVAVGGALGGGVGCSGEAAAPVGDGADTASGADTAALGDGACVPQPKSVCCGSAVCVDDGCGPQHITASCAAGCVDGACAACTPACTGRVCGDDGCGGESCGRCEGGAACADDGAACVCAPGVGLGCCGDAVCEVDSCGGVGAVVAACAFGCGDGACLDCEAPCGERRCGDNGCGASCGACEGGAECVDGGCVCVPDDHEGCCPEGDGRCAFDSCGGVLARLGDCSHGCADGACGVCTPACDGKACGADGCGGSCGECTDGTACDAAGQCSCTAAVGVACCGDAVCPVDSCGGLGTPGVPCAYGCADGACQPCVPACDGRVCGDDGCGGVCGSAACDGGSECVDGQCLCVDHGDVVCCDALGGGEARCALDGCGGALGAPSPCAYGCDGGACLPCVPACGERECGDDGCGGTCGGCTGGAVCDADGACVCVPTAGSTCCGDARCAVDSCGVTGDVIAACSWGCASGACLPCVPACAGKGCGPDGCGGSCGGCGTGEVCGATGQCFVCTPDCEGLACGDDGCGGSCGSCLGAESCDAGVCRAIVTGRFLRERILPNAALTALGPAEVVPVAHVPVLVSAGGSTLATGETGADGRYAVALDPAPTVPVTVTLVATAVGADGAPTVGLADATGVTFPSAPHQIISSPRAWAWTVTAAGSGLDLGDLTITATQGAGALQLFDWVRALRAFLMGLYGVDTVPALGILWSPTVTPMCLSCFFPSGWGPLRVPGTTGATDYARFIWFSGKADAPHQWVPSMVGHEYGHYVMDVFSRSPNEGGAHAWDTLLNPGLAWSEGFATFFGQRWLSGAAEQPRFFAVQQGTQYWVDIDRIGTAPTHDDSVFNGLVFPLPRAALPVTQSMNEAVVAAILWDLWDHGPLTGETETPALDDVVFELLASPRMLSAALERGYGKADLLDFLDAIRCAEALSSATMAEALMGFPYDNAPSCPE